MAEIGAETEFDGSEGSRGRTSRTLEKGLRLLGLFDVDHQEWTLRGLREATGESKTTVLRLVKTLESLGYLTRDGRTGKYRLGASIAKLTYVIFPHSELVRVAAPFMRRLSEQTNETVDIMVEIEPGAVMSLYDSTTRFLRTQSSIGKVLRPGLSQAGIKVLVAFRPEETWQATIAESVIRHTDRTITDPEELRRQLMRAREEGVAYDLGEWSTELAAVAAPVFGADGNLRAALSVISPVERFNEEVRARHADLVREAAADISRELGAPLERVAFLRNRSA